MYLDYKLHRDTELAKIDWPSASESSLRYQCFMGDIFIADGDSDLSAPWGWITLFDFAIVLRQGVRDLELQNRVSLTFTESDARIVLDKEGDVVILSASYADKTIHVDFQELRAKSDSFSRRLLGEIEHRHPGIRSNPNINLLVEG